MGIKFSEVKYSYTYSKKKKENYYNLQDASLEIKNSDEFICVVGHTGSGKSTFIQHLNMLLKPTFGKIEIEDENFKYVVEGNGKKENLKLFIDGKKQKTPILKPLRSKVGLVFQFPEYQLFEETVLKDIMFGPKNFSFEKKKEKKEKEAREKAINIANKMQIKNLLELSPFELSGGQMRRVAIAGILASNPDVLVLDEPTVGLDPIGKKELLQFLKDLNEKEHKTIIIVTHDMDVVAEYAKRVIVLNKAKITYDGNKTALFRNEKLLLDNNLNYPSIVLLLKKLKEKLNIKELNEYQYNIEDAFNEIKRWSK